MLRSYAQPERRLPLSAPPRWQVALREAVTDPTELCRLLDLPPRLARQARKAARAFPMLVPRPFLARIRPANPRDPLLAQILPDPRELARVDGFRSDPTGDGVAAWAPGLVWKYPHRVLMVPTALCGVHCRYCFRRHSRQRLSAATTDRWAILCRRIAGEKSIREVVLSGGDPLTLSDDSLSQLASHLASIPHLRRIRVHTRLPVVIPDRVTDELLAWLRGTRLTPVVVVHVNHPAEVDEAVARALGRLVDAGVPVLSQSVLLRRVNDSAPVLAQLCERLVDLRVQPYYLHQLDRVAGAAHFEVPGCVGERLIGSIRSQLPGYAVPRYVCDRPGSLNKTPLA
ncbi:MAG TPA: EF-P beta-lysylation protein EpmB [Planctomycetaceae bacterium]|nr:EF-P beta-lysylation protein EpmB [Planctomycetaceae bacterium]HIQ23116.1 EF-P beta-lysylation protein EpmB [Planctomycetota bacterium]